ncbi:type I-C CRISPR-associated protein Cas8c/Csd1 [bacterium]|nr:type I-C CRISPR-associated protein Cas8c/Csd1 [bacterium]
MILQSLYDYYQRNKDNLPTEGFQFQEIKFVIEIDKEGNFLNLRDTREGKKGTIYILPIKEIRTSSMKTNLLWDHYGYILAHPKDSSEKMIEMAKKQQKTFIDRIKNLPDNIKKDEGVNAVILFFEKGNWEEVKNHSNWEDCAKNKGCNLSFQLLGDHCLIPERETIKNYQISIVNKEPETDEEATSSAICLITGNFGPVKRLHTPTPIMGSKSNAILVGCQLDSGFDSYCKKQAFNAPVSSEAEFAYTTALKYLLKSEQNRIFIGDTTVIFWAQKRSTIEFDLEENFKWYLTSDKDDTERGVNAVKNLYKSIDTGNIYQEDDNRFFLLGLTPNSARITVRFWKTGTVAFFAENIKQHFDDFQIIHGPEEYEYLALGQILRATALENKMEKVPSNLSTSVLESILEGIPYPETLLHQCIRRIRAEQKITRTRAAILKAYINRFNRFYKNPKKEVLEMLDVENKEVGYLLGRLFAVLERIQIQSVSRGSKLNKTIRDRFWGVYSTSPRTVMPMLLRLKNHHIGKLEEGSENYFESLIAGIMEGFEPNKIPAHLTLEQQSYLAVGYYHQRQYFYKKKEIKKED